jgi:hypothetical protein
LLEGGAYNFLKVDALASSFESSSSEEEEEGSWSRLTSSLFD